MALKQVNQPEYRIERAGFEDVRFTKSFDNIDYTHLTDVFEIVKKSGYALPSLREEIAIRIDADHADGRQWTRTGAIYVPKGKKVYVAFDDAFMEEFALRNKYFSIYTADRKDKLIAQAIERARDTKRFVEVAKQGYLEIALSKFGTHEVAVAAAQDMAEPYAAHVKGKDFKKDSTRPGLFNDGFCFTKNDYPKGYYFSTGFIWLLKPKLAEGKVEVRPVSLGGTTDYSHIKASNQFTNGRQARGVRKI